MIHARVNSVALILTLAGLAPQAAIGAAGERAEKYWELNESGVFQFGPWVLFDGESVTPTSPPGAQDIAIFDVEAFGVPRQSGYDVFLDREEHAFAIRIADDVRLITGNSKLHAGNGGIEIGLGQARQGSLTLSGWLKSAGAVRVGSGGPGLPTSSFSMDSLSRLDAAGGVRIEQDGLINAAGRIQGQLTNSGRLSLFNGTAASLSVNAGFTQTGAGAGGQPPGGVTEIEILGPSENNDVLVVQGGSATLAGTLMVRLLNGYEPVPGELEAKIIYAPEFLGRFDVVYFTPELRGNRRLRLNYPPPALTEEERQNNAITVTVEALAPQPQIGDGSQGAADITGRPTRAVTADFNGDGFIDVAATIPVEPGAATGTTGGDTIVVLNRGVDSNGVWLGFLPPISIPAGYDPADIATGDLDGDDDNDLAVINKGTPDAANGSTSSPGLRIFLNDGAAGFTQFGAPDDFVYPVGNDPRGVAIGDFVHDDPPTLDIAVTSLTGSNTGQVVVLANNGTIDRRWGGLGSGESVPVNTNDPGPVSPGGLDNPKDIDDLAIGTGGGTNHEVTVLYNSGTVAQARGEGIFVTQVQIAVPGAPRYLAITDIDRDGDTDIVSSDRTSATLSLIINDSDRAGPDAGAANPFRVQSLPIGNNPGSVGAFDFDNDNDIDLAAVTDADSRGTPRVIRVLRNDTPFNAVGGPLTFSQGPVIDFGTNPRYALPGDVENDGDIDIIAFTDPPSANTQHATAFVNALCPTDLDGSGATDTNDLCKFLGVFGYTGEPGIPGDLNLDGVVDTQDLVRFLGRFGQACQ